MGREKRYFKIYCKQHVVNGQNKYVLLFDLIDNQAVFNDELITPELGICAIMDLTKHDEISFVIRNDFDSVTFPLYDKTEEIKLDIGQIVFKLDKNKYSPKVIF